jgi:hypothetical protein
MKIGPYVVERELGRGGMGVVHAGRSPSGAAVAIKLLLRTTKRETLARFDRERRLQAGLGEEAGFVPVMDVGDSPEGPWLAMPLVPGGTLRARLGRGPLGIEETVELGRALAQAAGRAHGLGIVHRDLKPENVLFTLPGAETGNWGRPLVSDLGLAKHFSSEVPGASQSVSLSRTGELVGTAGYMAPEQMNSAKEVGPPADVFSLGAILYECLAGEPAFEADSIHGVFAKVAQGDFAPVRKKRPDAPRWLAAVVERALAKEPADRFPDGAALAAALVAPPAARRSWAWVAAVLLVGGVVAAVVARGDGKPVETTTGTPLAPTVAATRSLTIGGHKDSIRGLALSPKGDLVVSACHDKKVRIFSTRDGALEKTLEGHGGEVLSVAWSPRGEVIASGSHDGFVLVWDPATGKQVRACLGAQTWTSAVAISSDWIAGGSFDGSVRLYSLRPGSDMGEDFQGKKTLVNENGSAVNSIAFSPDGRSLATASNDKAVRIWSLDSSSVVESHQLHPEEPLAVAWSPRGDLVASAGRDWTIHLWSTKEKREVRALVGHEKDVEALAFSPAGNVLVSGSADGTVRFWHVEEGRELARAPSHRTIVYALAVAPDFGFVASAGDDQVIRIDDVPREARRVEKPR